MIDKMSTPRQSSRKQLINLKRLLFRKSFLFQLFRFPSHSSEQRPATNDHQLWIDYWRHVGQPWRTEPEVDKKRQAYLTERRSIIPDIQQGTYPFKNIKLSRADVEWLIARHENKEELAVYNDEIQRWDGEIDLRGADLRHVDLRNLPLMCIRGGLTWDEWRIATEEQRIKASVSMQSADLSWAHLEKATLSGVQLSGANLSWAHLEKADLYGANLDEAILRYTQLNGAVLRRAHLKGANLFRANLEGANLSFVNLAGADIRSAFLDNATTLRDAIPSDTRHGFMLVADVRWSDVNLAVIRWPQEKWSKTLILGDEFEARKSKTLEGKRKAHTRRIVEYETAMRANRQLATELNDQGLSELADHFSYRAKLLQRVVWRRRMRFLKYIFSWFLYLIAGYGYRPLRSVMWYLFIIFGFAVAYLALGHLPPFPDAFVFSVMSFHGRGFFPNLNGETNLHNPLVVLAAFEAIIGLFIEISFIATFTQRYLGK